MSLMRLIGSLRIFQCLMSLQDSQTIGPLHDTNVVVTGASSGIGRQIAIQFAAHGCQNLLVHFNRSIDAAESTAKQVGELGTSAVIDRCDFANPADTTEFVARAFDRWLTIDAWVHCAGADVLTGEAAQWSFERKLLRLINVDFVGSILLGRMVGERLRNQATMLKREFPASVLFIGWDQATEGMEGDAGQMFGPIKAGVEAFAKSLAQELSPIVRVNTIAPGWIQTEWGKTTSDYWNDRAINQSLMHRWGTPDDIAAAAVFLSTPSNDFITGQTIQVNGGWNRRYETK